MAKKFNLSICLEDIPNGLMHWAKEGNNGKHYINFTIVEMNNVGKYGDTHFVKLSEKVNDEWQDAIVGHIKPIESKETKTESKPAPAAKEEDEVLPF